MSGAAANTLVLPDVHRDVVAAAARAAYPAECCGLLIGRAVGDGYVVTEVRPTDNLSSEPLSAFEVDFAVRLRREKELAGSERRILGIYHSHPGASAQPSPRDLEAAWEPGLIWLIAGIGSAGVGDVAAFQYQDDDGPGGRFRALSISAGTV